MTPAARLQAAIEILDEVIASARDDGPPADAIVTRYFKQRRYAGSKDRRAVRELVFRAIRRSAERPESGRAAMLGLAEDEPELLELFGQPRGPEPSNDGEAAAPAGVVPEWLRARAVAAGRRGRMAGAARARAARPAGQRRARIARRAARRSSPDAEPTPLSPWGIRLPPDSRVDDHPAFADGLVEVQDEGSQLIALACEPADGERILDLCAGAGGKALALAAAAPDAHDPRDRQQSRAPVEACRRAPSGPGATIETRLLNPPQRARRARRLARPGRPRAGRCALLGQRHLAAQSRRALAADARAARPRWSRSSSACSTSPPSWSARAGGWSMRSARCCPAKGQGRLTRFLSRHSSWISAGNAHCRAGVRTVPGRLLTPGHDGTDGFFVARLGRPC